MKTSDQIIQERSGLIKQAEQVGYKPVCPKLPKHPNKSTMMGFESRFMNWKKGLRIYIEDNQL